MREVGGRCGYALVGGSFALAKISMDGNVGFAAADRQTDRHLAGNEGANTYGRHLLFVPSEPEDSELVDATLRRVVVR